MNKGKNNGITLIALIITIVVLIILAAVAVNMTIGDNGIFTKAKESKKMQLISEAKEKIGTEILSAQMDATERDEELEQTQIEDIVSKYGELQADGDTIVLNDNGYEVSLKDIYSGTTTTGGSYSELKAQVALLKQQLADANLSGGEASQQLNDLKTTLSGTTVTEDKILKDYKAYKDGALITGTMANNAGKTVVASNKNSDDANIYLTIPEAGYYDTTSIISSTNVASDKFLASYVTNAQEGGHYVSPTYANSNLGTVSGQQITVKKSGTIYYRFLTCGQAYSSGTNQTFYATLYKNGSAVASNSAATVTSYGTGSIQVKQGDVLKFYHASSSSWGSTFNAVLYYN